MKTFLPPKRGSASQDNAGTIEHTDYLDLCRRKYPAARRVAVRSIVPGLGQLKNGEYAKGWLFLAITVINMAALSTFVFNAQFAKLVSERFHTSFGGPALIIYALLLLGFVAYAISDAYERAVQIIRDKQRFPAYRLTLPEAASGSYLFHFAMISAFMIMVVFFLAPPPPSSQVTEIELVHERAKAESPKPPSARKAPRRIQQPKPTPVVQHKPVVQPKPVIVHKVEPPKPTPVAVAVPTKEPTPITAAPVEASAPAAPSTTGSPAGSGSGGGHGGPGIGGSGTGDREVDMGPYMRELQRKIKHAWYPPKGNESKRIKVSFKVHKDGTISHLKLVSSSGVDVADDAATQAVENAAPFAQLPDGVGDDVDINFTFDYNVFGRGSRG